MRTAILTDIHGNFRALETVWAAVRARGVDHVVSLGDVVGYGPRPEDCVQWVREMASESLLGNHDAILSGRAEVSFAKDDGRRMIERTGELLSSGSIAWLRRRPYVHILPGQSALLSHGSPLVPSEYRYIQSVDDAGELVTGLSRLLPITFMGHTHVERSFRVWSRGVSEIRTRRLRFEGPFSWVVNVGSVGQPRDRDPRAAAAIFDDVQRSVEFVRVPYDVDGVVREMRAVGMPDAFARRLRAGW